MSEFPKPIFSPNNPYWQRIVIDGVAEDYQPRLSAQDFNYAWTWELTTRQQALVVHAINFKGWVKVWIHVFKQRFRATATEISRKLRKPSEGQESLLTVQAFPSAT